MRALHLPSVPFNSTPTFRFPDRPPTASDLHYTAPDFPEPQSPTTSSSPSYLIRVLTTALTRGELTWAEILERSRFHPYGSAIPGHDVVGVIEKVFQNSSTEASAPKFSIGDKVWSLLDFDRDGAAATYTIALENELSLAPSGLPNISETDWDEMLATLPLSGLTAYQALFIHGDLPSMSHPTPSEHNAPRVLVTGASGSVGAPTIHLAKAAGFRVIAVCSSSSRSFVKDTLHADEIIDYADPNFKSVPESFESQSLKHVDLVIDCIGGAILRSILLDPSKVLKRGGKIITIVAPIHVYGPELSTEIQKSLDKADVKADFFIVKPDGAALDELGKAVSEGKLKAHVDEVFELEKGREAMELVESRGRRGGGKIVLRVAKE